MSCIPSSSKCSPATASVNADLAALVRLYRIHNRADSEKEIKFFRDMPSFELAVHHAALATDDRGKRYSHQRRISQSPLKSAKQILAKSFSKIEKCGSFHELYSWLAEALGAVHGLGELYIYDTAFRLGAFRRLAPEFVYLHRGTRAGAQALGIGTSGDYLAIADLPKPLRSLAPHEMEDFLCIYKGHFTK
jgi:hypothetical protein